MQSFFPTLCNLSFYSNVLGATTPNICDYYRKQDEKYFKSKATNGFFSEKQKQKMTSQQFHQTLLRKPVGATFGRPSDSMENGRPQVAPTTL